MPLIKSGSDAARQTNIDEMIRAGHDPKQAVAASYSNQRKYRAEGGRIAGLSPHAEPTDGQKEAGNYKKHHIKVHGLDIAIENPRDSERSGTGKDGKRWSVKMPDHYGYIKQTEGSDGDHVDCYVGHDTNSQKVYIVDQLDADTGKFDEHKCMIGYPDHKSAVSAYEKGFSDGKGKRRIGSVTELSVDRFKDWLKSNATKKPMSNGVSHMQKRAEGGKVKRAGFSDALSDAPMSENIEDRRFSNQDGPKATLADVLRFLVARENIESTKLGRDAGLDDIGRAAGGQVPWFVRQEASHLNHPVVGPIRGITPGRADAMPVKVPTGSYVIPSAAVSHMGQNNTESGFHVADRMFHTSPVPHLPRMKASGGQINDGTTEIMISPGEYVVHPSKVQEIGGGDLDNGHKVMDVFVKKLLADNAKTAAKLPGPAKD